MSSSSTYWPRWRGPRKWSRTRALRGLAHPLGGVRVGEQRAARARRRRRRSRGSTSRPVTPSSIWSWMPPTSVATTGRALPHRLGDGQPEALGEALLHDDVGAPLQRVDDDRVLVGVVHRQQREVDPAADRRRQRVPGRLDLGEDLGALGVVGDRGDVRARRARGAAPRRPCTCSAKPASTPSGSLSRSQRETCATSGVSSRSGCLLDHRAPAARRGRCCRRAARTPRATGGGGRRRGRRRAAPRSRW